MADRSAHELRYLAGEVGDCMNVLIAKPGPSFLTLRAAREALAHNDIEELRRIRDCLAREIAGGHGGSVVRDRW